MATVTYEGPVTPADPSTQYIVILDADEAAGREETQTFTFQKGVAAYDVPGEVVEQLSAFGKGHRFDIVAASDAEAKRLTPDEPEEGEELGEVSVTPQDAAEPWEGYDDEDVEDVVEALRTAHVVGNEGLIEHVKAYEGEHKARKTILEYDPAEADEPAV